MSARIKRHAQMIKLLGKSNAKFRKQVIANSDDDFIKCLCEICHNTLKGNVPLSPYQKKNLTRYRKDLRAVANKTKSLKVKRKILQKGGFLPFIIPALAGILGPIVGKIFEK